MDYLDTIKEVKKGWILNEARLSAIVTNTLEEAINEKLQNYDTFVLEDELLHVAAFFGHNSSKTLLELGANVNARNHKMRTPLHFALDPINLSVFNQSLVKEMLLRGADVNAVDTHGLSPLHLAMKSKLDSKNDIELLLRYGADPDVLDKMGRPPIAYCGSEEIQLLLIQYTVFNNLLTKFNQQSRNKTININDVMSLSFCGAKRKRRRLIEARRRCFDDMVRMNTDEIAPNQTLFQYISERYVRTSSNEQMNTLEQTPVEVLSRFANDVYPSCEVIFSSCLRRVDLLHTLFHCSVYTKTDCFCYGVREKLVTLTWQCVEHLTEYLSNKCLINMILAYGDLKSKNTK